MGKEWVARDLLQLSGAYWASCALQAAVQLDVFTALHNGPQEQSVLAEQLGCDQRAFGMLITALSALELVEWEGKKIKAPEQVVSLLSASSPEYLGFIIKHHASIMSGWSKLAKAVLTGSFTTEKAFSKTLDVAGREVFLMGMFNIARLQASRIAEALDLSGCERLLDLGGGSGAYSLFFCQANPHLKAVLFDLPPAEPVARKLIKHYGLEGRITFLAGDYLTQALPQGFDVVWLSQVLHGEGPESAASMVRHAVAALNPGGLCCIQEFMLDDDRKGPVHAALFSLNMLVQTPAGQAYSQGELTAMLHAAGAKRVRSLDITLPDNCGVLIGMM